MGIVLFVAGNLAAILTAASLVNLLNIRGSRWLRATAGLVLYGTVIVAVLLITGTLGVMRAWPVVAIMSAAAAVCVILATRARILREPSDTHRHDDGPIGPMMRLFVAITVGLGAATVAHICFAATSFAFDDLVHHGPAVAHWIQTGSLSLGSFGYQAYQMHHAELISLWFALPMHSDALVSLGSAFWLILLLAAVTSLARQMGARGWVQAVPALGVLLSTQIMAEVASFTPTSLAETASIAAALALLTPLIQSSVFAGKGTVLCAGFAAGLAIGIRSSALPLVTLLLIIVLVLMVQERRLRDGARFVAILLIAILVTGGYWYARNIALTGNPFYPAEFGAFEGPFVAQARAQTTLFHQLRQEGLDAVNLAYTGWRLLNWPRPLGLLALTGYGIGIAVAVSRLQRARHRTVLTILAIGVVGALTSPLLPFSGSPNLPDAPITIALRFWMIPFTLGLVLVAASRSEWVRWLAPVVGVILALAVYSGLAGHAPMESRTPLIVGLVLGVMGALWWHGVRRRLWFTFAEKRSLFALSAAILVVLGAWAPTKQSLTDIALFAHGQLGDGWRAVDALPAEARITWFGPGTHAYYPLYGRSYQLDPVPVFADGSPWVPMHRREDLPESWWDVIHYQQDWSTAVEDDPALVDNLLAQGIDYVFTTEFSTDRWRPHPQVETLAASDIALPLYEDAASTIWNMRRTTAQEPAGDDMP